MKWGCSVQDLKNKYPEAVFFDKNNEGDEVYSINNGESIRMFFFGEGKLYLCRLGYSNCSMDKMLAIVKKINDTYGVFNDSSKGTDFVKFIWNYSSKIDIDCMSKVVDNKYIAFMISYTNNELRTKIIKERVNKMQDDLEL